MSFPNVINGTEEETFTADATQGVPVGTKMVIEDGRAFRYSKAGASPLVAALMNSAAIPEVAKYGDQACDTMAAGATVITAVAAATTNMAANELINGYSWSEQTTQLGACSRIKSNTLITQGAATGTITLYNGLPLLIAEADTISYIRNNWMNVIIHATTSAAEVAGVTVCAIPAATWGWLQVSGPAKLQTSGTPAVTSPMKSVGTAAGECTVAAVNTDVTVGRFLSHEQGDEDGLFMLTIE